MREASGWALLVRTSSLSEEEDFSSHPARLAEGREAWQGCVTGEGVRGEWPGPTSKNLLLE